VRVHHLALRTGDLGALERFYGGVLALAVVRRDGARSTWLDAGGAIVMLERREPGEPPVPSGSRELVAFALDPDAARAVRERLAAAGVALEAETPSTLYVRDPDGRRVGLSVYPGLLEPEGSEAFRSG
jgi:glyoxylase I family protein